MTVVDTKPSSVNSRRAPRPVPPKVNPRRKAPWPIAFYRSTVGKKVVMAVTGIMLMGFVVVHMIGNMKMYLGMHHGEYAIDIYGEWLRTLGEPALPRNAVLWMMRGGLLMAVVFHIHSAYALTRINRKARSTKYQSPRDYVAANFASRTMRMSGVIVLLFIAWHLADLTWGWANPEFEHGAAYNNIGASLSRVPIAALYVVANVALGVHLFHGAWSIFQSLGRANPRFAKAKVWGARAFAAVIVIGNVSFPLAWQFGILDRA